MSSGKAKDKAKEIIRGQREEVEVTLSTGVRVRLTPVSSSLVEEIKVSIPMPDVPVVWIEGKEREEENPNDPQYIMDVEEVNRQRSQAIFDALILFGVELVDGLPESDGWIKRLKFLEKRGGISLEDFDLTDAFDKEFLYLRYVAIAGDDLPIISGLHGFKPMEVARARAMFLGDKERDSDRGTPTEEPSQDGD